MNKSFFSLALVATLFATGAIPSLAQNAKEQEAKFIAVLKSEAPQKEKADACRELAQVGTKDAVPALAALLSDEKLSHMARFGLEPIPDPSVEVALRAALGQVQGRLLAGVIGSLGVRQDAQAAAPLAGFLKADDSDVAQATARALGKIATPAAIKALQDTVASAPAGNQLAFCEGLFRCAEATTAKGDRPTAIAIYDHLRTLPVTLHQVRAGVLRGAVLSRQQDGLPILLEALRGNDFVLVDAAARIALEMTGRAVSTALADEFPKLPVDKQVLLTLTLARRGDPVAIPALSAAAKAGDKTVRIAAIRALPEFKLPSVAPLLAGLLAEGGEIAEAAKESLAGVAGAEVDNLVLNLLATGDSQTKLTAVDLLARRRMVSAIPALLKAAGSTDAQLRSAAYKRVGELGGPAELPIFLDALMAAKTTSGLEALEQPLGVVAVKANAPDATAQKLAAFLPQAQPAQKSALLRVLSTVGGPVALKAVSGAVSDPNADVHATAIRALGDWKTMDAAPDLLALAKSATLPTDKLLCLRSYLGLVSTSELPVDQRLSMCQQAAPLAEKADEKKLLLSALGAVAAPESLSVIVPYLADAAVRDEAGAAIVGIADKLLKARNASRVAAKLIEPLGQVAKATNANLAKRAQALLEQAQAKAGVK